MKNWVNFSIELRLKLMSDEWILLLSSNREQNWFEHWVGSTERLSLHQVDDPKRWLAGNSTVSVLQRHEQVSDGELCALLLLQERWKSAESGRYFEELGQQVVDTDLIVYVEKMVVNFSFFNQ